MKYREYIDERVHSLYWKDDLNCAVTSLLILAEIFQINLNPQILDAAIGMPGAGRYGAQCGLVEEHFISSGCSFVLPQAAAPLIDMEQF